MTLNDIFDKHGTDKGRSCHSLGDFYEPFLTGISRVIEIGVYKGASINAFGEFFGPSSQIVGIDIKPICTAPLLPNVSIEIGDATDPQFLQHVAGMLPGGAVDMVLDDASHKVVDQLRTLEGLLPFVRPGGIYIVEDVCLSDAGALVIGIPESMKVIGWHRYPRKPEMFTCVLRRK